MKTNLIISGVGGQGVITLGMLISQTAISQGENVIMSEIHGLAQRGGSVSVDIRIGDFHAPIIPTGEVDLVIGMEPLEAKRVLDRASTGTNVIATLEKLVPVSLSIRHEEYPDVDSIISSLSEHFNVRSIDAVAIAEKLGNYKAANVVVFGFAIGTGFLPLDEETAREQIKTVFSSRALKVNLEAFEYGLETGRSMAKISQ